jgi:hypothetical protein
MSFFLPATLQSEFGKTNMNRCTLDCSMLIFFTNHTAFNIPSVTQHCPFLLVFIEAFQSGQASRTMKLELLNWPLPIVFAEV